MIGPHRMLLATALPMVIVSGGVVGLAYSGILPTALEAIAVAAGREQSATEAEGPRPAAAVERGDFLLASGEGISVFDRDGTMKFGKFATALKDGKPEPLDYSDMVYDGHWLPSGNYLYSSHHYIREITPGGKTVWEYRVKAPVELKTCVPLPNGDVMTVDADRMELVQLTDHGRKIARRISVSTMKEATPHYRYNLLRRTPAGTYLLALRFEKAFVEVDDQWKELWRYEVPGNPTVAERLANGHTLMSWQGGMIEATPERRIAWEVKAAEIKAFKVIRFGGFHRFANGNTLVANSDWHYKDARETQVQVFEITHDKRVVWKLGVEAFAGKKPGSLEPLTRLVEHRLVGIHWLGGKSAP